MKNYDNQHYDLLIQCSDKKNMTDWNEFVKNISKDEQIKLDGADLSGVYLEGANLGGAHLEGAIFKGACLHHVMLGLAHLERVNFTDAHLVSVNFIASKLQGANFSQASVKSSKFAGAILKKSIFKDAYVENSNFVRSNFEEAKLHNVHFKDVNLITANLSRADLSLARIDDSNLSMANIESTNFNKAYFQKTFLNDATCDNFTTLAGCITDDQTDFRFFGVGNVIMSPGFRQLIEHSQRRMNWNDWYREKRWLQRTFMKGFWWLSDYGRSSTRILKIFFLVSLFFAYLYSLDLNIVNIVPGFSLSDPWYIREARFLRALYFSIVTMTTLGFGDITALALTPKTTLFQSLMGVIGYLSIIFQVIIGYAILGALVTRLSIMFTAGGPAEEYRTKDEYGFLRALRNVKGSDLHS